MLVVVSVTPEMYTSDVVSAVIALMSHGKKGCVTGTHEFVLACPVVVVCLVLFEEKSPMLSEVWLDKVGRSRLCGWMMVVRWKRKGVGVR